MTSTLVVSEDGNTHSYLNSGGEKPSVYHRVDRRRCCQIVQFIAADSARSVVFSPCSTGGVNNDAAWQSAVLAVRAIR